MLLQQLANGVMLGSTYALVAIGYTLVFGVLRLLHLAHGEVFMVGAFIGLQLVLWCLGPLVAIAGALVVALPRYPSRAGCVSPDPTAGRSIHRARRQHCRGGTGVSGGYDQAVRRRATGFPPT